jgi:hypothetical protein
MLYNPKYLINIVNINLNVISGRCQLQQGPRRPEVLLLLGAGPQVSCLLPHRASLQDQAHLSRLKQSYWIKTI